MFASRRTRPARKAVRPIFSPEALESRRLMSVVNIPAGASSAQIQSIIDHQSAPGDTVLFSGGTYNLSTNLIFRGGRTYQGASDTVLSNGLGSGQYGAQLDTGNANDITIDGITFLNGGVRVESAFGLVNGLTIQNCTFTAPTGLSHRNENEMIFITSGTSNTLITNNVFNNIGGGGYGMLMYNVTSTRVVNNTFNHVAGDGIAYYAYTHDGGKNVQLANNFFTDMPDKAIETGGPGAHGVDISYNQISGYVDGTLSDDTMGLSIVFWSNQPQYPVGTVTIHDNTIVGPNFDIEHGQRRPGVRIAIEAAGDNTDVYNNHVCGTNVGVAIGYSMQPSSVHDNEFLGTNYPSGIVYEGYSPPWHLYNNDSSSPPTCTIALNPTPIPGPVFGGGTPTPTPTPTPTGTPPLLSAAGTSNTSITLSWSDTDSNLAGYLIERREPTDTGFNQIFDTTTRTDGGSPTQLTFVDTGLPSGTYVYYRIRSVDKSGNISPYSNVAVAKTTGAKTAAYVPAPATTRAVKTDSLTSLFNLLDPISPLALD